MLKRERKKKTEGEKEKEAAENCKGKSREKERSERKREESGMVVVSQGGTFQLPRVRGCFFRVRELFSAC